MMMYDDDDDDEPATTAFMLSINDYDDEHGYHDNDGVDAAGNYGDPDGGTVIGMIMMNIMTATTMIIMMMTTGFAAASATAFGRDGDGL